MQRITAQLLQAIHDVAESYMWRTANPLRDPSKLRYQAIFLMGAGGSGKGYVSHRWMKYMPGGGSLGADREQVEELSRKVKPQERALSNLDFRKSIQKLQAEGIDIEIGPDANPRIPFRIFDEDRKEIPPSQLKNALSPEVAAQVEHLKELVFTAPKNEIPNYWRQVNPDIYKEEIPGYNPKNPGHVHEMSSTMKETYLHSVLETGDPVFVDGTGNNVDKLMQRMALTKKAGYRVSLVYVVVPLTVNQIRNATRERTVSAKIITRQWRSIRKNFVKARSLASVSHVIDNRDDEKDKKKYEAHEEEIDAIIARSYRGEYTSLKDLIKKKAPLEYKEWARLLKW